jgi:rod shape determining protein RodA
VSRSGFLGLRHFGERVDRPALAAILALLAISLLTLYSVTNVPPTLGDEPSVLDVGREIFWRQLVWIGFGLGALYVGFWVPYKLLETSAWLQYVVALVSLVLVLLIGHGNDVERWIRLGPIQFQPSEVAKVAFIFVLARYLAGLQGDVNRLSSLILPIVLVLPPVALILRQPDLGTALVFLAILVPMLYWRGLRPVHILLLGSPGVGFLLHLYFRTQHGTWWPWLLFVVAVFGITLWRRVYLWQNISIFVINLGVHLLEPRLWSHLHDYQQQRILSFFNPELDRLGTGYHVAQSMIAVGSGGFLGQGYLAGTQKQLAFIPARHTDFIFSVVGEEFGLIGGIVVLALFTVLILRGITFANRARNGFVRYAAFGIMAYMAFQVVQNIGMTVGMFPVTGIPLPLVSYGGSSLLVTMFLLGVLLNLGSHWREY